MAHSSSASPAKPLVLSGQRMDAHGKNAAVEPVSRVVDPSSQSFAVVEQTLGARYVGIGAYTDKFIISVVY